MYDSAACLLVGQHSALFLNLGNFILAELFYMFPNLSNLLSRAHQ